MNTCGQCGTTHSDSVFHRCEVLPTIDTRTLLAGMAMQGLVSNAGACDPDFLADDDDRWRIKYARAAVRCADALLLELSKPTAKETT